HDLVSRPTSRPIVVLNSHTHNDHVGDNWQFPFIFGMTLRSPEPTPKVHATMRNPNSAKICSAATLPKLSIPQTTPPSLGKFPWRYTTALKSISAPATSWRSSPRPAILPTQFACSIALTACSLPALPT